MFNPAAAVVGVPEERPNRRTCAGYGFDSFEEGRKLVGWYLISRERSAQIALELTCGSSVSPVKLASVVDAVGRLDVLDAILELCDVRRVCTGVRMSLLSSITDTNRSDPS